MSAPVIDQTPATLGRIADGVAVALGGTWTVSQRPVSTYDYAEISTRATGRGTLRLLLRWADQRGGKLTVTGVYPAHHVYGLKSPRIGVSAARGADAVGREIMRRLLPEYIAGVDRIEDANYERRERHRERLANAGLLSSPFGDQARHSDDENSASTSFVVYGPGPSVEVRVFETTGDLKVTGVPIETLHQVLKLLADAG